VSAVMVGVVGAGVPVTLMVRSAVAVAPSLSAELVSVTLYAPVTTEHATVMSAVRLPAVLTMFVTVMPAGMFEAVTVNDPGESVSSVTVAMV
jgi:hypothetical protein